MVDIVVAVVGLIVSLPVVIVAAIAIRSSMGPGVLYRQQRLGLGGHPFDVLKLRTMRAPALGQDGVQFDAQRVTRLGLWLRATSIDELPSLVNLLSGQLTLVGPRPLPVHYFPRFIGDEYQRFEVKPGITGLAQVNGRNELDWPAKLAFDVQYVRTRSLLGDLGILVRTVPAVLGRSGVSHPDAVTMHELPPNRA